MNGTSWVVQRAACLLCLLGLPFSTGFGQEPAAHFRSKVRLGPREGVGLYRYYPGHWNTIQVRLTNSLDRDVVLRSSAYVGDDASLQSGRSQWFPAQSAMETSYPLWIPLPPQARPDSCQLQTQIFEFDGQSEQLVRDSTGKFTTTDLVPLCSLTAAAGFIGPAFDAANKFEEDALRQFVTAIRKQNQLPTTIHEIPDRILPALPEAYSPLESLIVADDRVCDDEAALSAIREWVTAGGWMWIMMDRVEATTVERLLGDRCDITEIDRVELNSFRLTHRVRDDDVHFASEEHEQPIPFVRVSSASAKVEFQIDNWPAAFWLDYGAGRVLVTTLGARGWMSPPRGNDPPLIAPAVDMTVKFFAPKSRADHLPDELQSVVEGYIGYSIPERRWIVSLLGGFAAVLFFSVAALWYARRLEWMAIVTPGLGLAFGALLILTGFRNQHAVGATIGQLQVAEPVPGGDVLRVRGISGLYFPDSQMVPIAGQQGGRLIPDMTGLAGMNRRLVWTDYNRWQWENLQQPGGLRLAEFTTSARMAAPVHVDATLGPDGVHGFLKQKLTTTPEDAILLTSSGRVGVKLDATGKFAAGPDDVLGAGQYLAADVLSDAQRRRSKVLETLLGGTTRGQFPRQPSIAYWTAPIDGGLRFGEGLQELGEALVLVPIEFHRPEPGVEIVIPAPLVQIREGYGPDGTVQRGLIESRSGEWQERSGPTTAWLRLQLPPALVPLELQSLNVVVRVTGKLGRLQLGDWKDGGLHTLHSWEAPVGTLKTDLTDMSSLSVANDGTVHLFVSGGEADRPEAASSVTDRKDYWRIESMEISVRGRIAAVEDTR